MSEETEEAKGKGRHTLKWRLQYGRRPPKKTDLERDEEQEMIEQFLKNRGPEPVSEQPAKKASAASAAASSRKDQKLVAKFLEKRVQNLS